MFASLNITKHDGSYASVIKKTKWYEVIYRREVQSFKT